MNSDHLKDKIKRWLTSEDYEVSEKDDQSSDFHLVISNLHGKGTFADIVKLKNKDFVILGSALQNPPEFLRLLSTIAEKERYDFFDEIQRELLHFAVDHEFHPNKIMPERMIVRDTVYEEDLSRTVFMEHVKRVKFASLFLLWSIGHRFSSDITQSLPHPSSTSGSRPPYG